MDRYSRIVLTVIAVALSAIALQNSGLLPSSKRASFSAPALADTSGDGQKVQICNWDGFGNPDCARVQGGRLNVRIFMTE
jgi:hypothetical protein